MLSRYKQKPPVAAAAPNKRLSASGKEVVDPKPHPLLLMAAKPKPIAEQVAELTRHSRERRRSIMDMLPAEYFGEHIEDDLTSEGLTVHELAGQSDSWPELRHEVPEVSGREEPSQAPQKPKEQPSEGV